MTYARLHNGSIQHPYPRRARLADGRWVSGYDSLMEGDEALRFIEGWRPVVDDPPEYDAETHNLRTVGLEPGTQDVPGYRATVDTTTYDFLEPEYLLEDQQEFEDELRQTIAVHLSEGQEEPVDPGDVELPSITYEAATLQKDIFLVNYVVEEKQEPSPYDVPEVELLGQLVSELEINLIELTAGED